MDLIGNLISYKGREEKGLPSGFPALAHLKLDGDQRYELFQSMISDFSNAESAQEAHEIEQQIKKLFRRPNMRPLHFGRCDVGHSDMALLKNPDTGKYYALLHVVPSVVKNKPLHITKEHNLFCVRTNKQVIKRSSTGLLFPLETGERMLHRFFDEGDPKSGHLTYNPDRDEFYLHVAFEFTPDEIQPQTIMGIDRGLVAICAYSVLSDDGQFTPITHGLYEGHTLKSLLKAEQKRMAEIQAKGQVYRLKIRKRWADRIIHEAVNETVDVALKYKSQVYVEKLDNLTDRSKKRKKNNFNYALSYHQYSKFLKVLTYRLLEVGLPAPKEVNAAWTSCACPICGNIDIKNRPKKNEEGIFIQDVFRCRKCGHFENADLNAGRIIAIKGKWQYVSKTEKERKKIMTFSTYLDTIKKIVL